MPPLRHVQSVRWVFSLVFLTGLIWQADAKEDWETEALERWHQKRQTLPEDWEEQAVATWREAYGRRLQAESERAASIECQTNPVKNVSQCCGRLMQEVTDLCMDYAALGFTDATCRGWRHEIVAVSCNRHCGHCNRTSEVVFEICKFSLQVLGDGALITKYCKGTRDDYLLYRCPTACQVPDNICHDSIADSCMEECGTYYPCHCRYRKTTLLPETCLGTPVIHGPIPNRTWENYTCDMPPKCMHHRAEGQRCAKYRWCRPDLCVIQRVECIPPDQCSDDGVCKPDEGLCFFRNRPNGYPCDDEISYTVRDQCVKGYCEGTPDMCIKYNSTCKSLSTCLTGGSCQPGSGRCTYDVVPDGRYCDDGRPYTVEDQCVNGFCLGRAVDLCVDNKVVCTAPNECLRPGVCDPHTAACSLPVPLSTRTCDDKDSTTANDTCIDGICVGKPIMSQFLTLGDGECSDKFGRRMARYIGDTPTEQECETVCLEDAQCRAFNYAYPSCSIWGTVRIRAPTGGRPWSFLAGTVPQSAIKIEMASPTAHGQRAGICRIKSETSDTVVVDNEGKVEISSIFSTRVLIIFFFTLLVCFGVLPIGRCIRTCLCGPPTPKTQVEKLDGAGEDDLRFTADAYNERPPPSPAKGGVSSIAALADSDPMAASPGAESVDSNDLTQLPAPPEFDSDEPAPPDQSAPELPELQNLAEGKPTTGGRWTRSPGKRRGKKGEGQRVDEPEAQSSQAGGSVPKGGTSAADSAHETQQRTVDMAPATSLTVGVGLM